MDTVFAFLLAGSVLALPVGLIVPKIFGGGRTRAVGLSLMLMLVSFIGFAATHEAPDRAAPGFAGAGAQQVAASAIPPKPEPPPLPQAQQQMNAIVADYAARYRAAANDMAKGATRPARAQALCAALKNDVRDWRGTVDTLSSTNDGNGVLAVKIGPNVTLGTWNNTLSDALENTVIRPGSAVHTAAMGLRKRQAVIFSGTLFRGRDDCFNEMSLSVPGAMDSPEFVFRFSSIRPAD